jgi:hypothetical protein
MVGARGATAVADAAAVVVGAVDGGRRSCDGVYLTAGRGGEHKEAPGLGWVGLGWGDLCQVGRGLFNQGGGFVAHVEVAEENKKGLG